VHIKKGFATKSIIGHPAGWVRRLADVGDRIPPMIQGRLADMGKYAKFTHVHFKGSRSFIVG